MNNDIVVFQTNKTNQSNTIYKAPYLIVILLKKEYKKFIAIEKPEIFQNHLTAKGFFTSVNEYEIMEKISDIINSTSRELYTEMSFPLSKVEYIKNLIYKAK